MSILRRTVAPLVLIVAALSLLMTGTAPASATRALADALADAAERDAVAPYTDVRERHAVPADRYEMAGGCYVLSTADGYVQDGGTGYSVAGTTAEEGLPLYFQAFDLGKYLLLGDTGFLSAEQSPLPYTRTGANLAEDLVEGLAIEATDALVEYLNFSVEDATGVDAGLDAELVGDPVLAGLTDAATAADAGTADARYATRGTAIVPAGAPSSAAEWVVSSPSPGQFTFDLAADDLAEDDQGPLNPVIVARLGVAGGELALVDPADDTATFNVELVDAARCPDWAEIDVNVAGDPATGTGSADETRGYIDAHLHMMAFEFVGGQARCGRPWHPYGVTYALVDCADHEPGGHGAMLEHVLSGTDPVAGHDTVGWPTFGYWPNHRSLTHEQVYYRWMERAWRGGLRMFTNLLVDNGVLCEIYPLKQNSCNEMDGVRLQILRLHELERYIDAQHGGPGQGWFRIVTDPFEAREVINSGRLAVVMGIEISVLFDCGEYNDVPRCDEIDIDRQLTEFYEAGVRQMELVNKFDNALAGVTGDGGTTGAITNGGNRHETGHFIRMDTCEDDSHGHDHTQPNMVDEGFPREIAGRDAMAGGILALSGQVGALPMYPEGPHCNTAGLSDLGRVLLDQMVDYGLLFDPDHMAALARHQAMDHLAESGYSGVVSSHSWADDTIYPRVLQAGGMVTPYAGGAQGFVNKWRQHRGWADGRFTFGFGYGADTNGFGGQGGPVAGAVTYPFTGLGGVTVDQQVSGERVYDYATDGTAHYGLYADWIEAIVNLADASDTTDDGISDGDLLRADMEMGPEAYLQTWERALGIGWDACLDTVEDLTAADVAAVATGDSFAEVLTTLGQPTAKDAGTMTYCGPDGLVTVTLDAAGTVSAITTA